MSEVPLYRDSRFSSSVEPAVGVCVACALTGSGQTFPFSVPEEPSGKVSDSAGSSAFPDHRMGFTCTEYVQGYLAHKKKTSPGTLQ